MQTRNFSHNFNENFEGMAAFTKYFTFNSSLSTFQEVCSERSFLHKNSELRSSLEPISLVYIPRSYVNANEIKIRPLEICQINVNGRIPCDTTNSCEIGYQIRKVIVWSNWSFTLDFRYFRVRENS